MKRPVAISGTILIAVHVALACGEVPSRESGEVARWSLSAEPVAVIGLADGDPAYILSRIRSARLLPDGGVVVADGGSETVRLYSAEGLFQRQMGGRGEGPGEFTYISSLSIAPPDTITTYDSLARRMSKFRTNGDLLLTQQFYSDTGNPEQYIGTFSDGSHAVAWIRLTDRRDAAVVTPDIMQIGRFDGAGQLEALLGAAPGMRRLGSPVPFSPHFLAVMFEDELFFTDGMGGTIQTVDARNDSTRTFRLAVEPLDLEEAWLRLEREMQDDEGLDELRRIREIPGTDSIPDFSDLLVDDEGLLWLKRYNPATDSHRLVRPRNGGEWLIVERSGQILATLQVPVTFRPLDIRGNRVAGLARDEFGVERIQVYELSRSG